MQASYYKSTARHEAAATRKLIRQLEKMRDTFGPQSARDRLAAVRNLARRRILNPADLLLYHDLLCFIRAYPDNNTLLELAERELQAFGRRVADYKRLTRDKKGVQLDDSGLDGSVTCYQYNYDITRYLLEHYPDSLEINWENTHDDFWYTLGNMLALLVSHEENDSIENDDDFDGEDFLALSGGDKNQLKALCNLFAGSDLQPKILRDSWENLGLLIDWDLTGSPAARNVQRVSMRERFYQQEPLRPRTKDLQGEVIASPPMLRRVSVREGQVLLNTLNEVLAIRNRELYPVTFGNPAEVYTYDPGRGARIIVYGSIPEARMPLESNFGALLVRNGMIVGYGVAVLLFDRAEIAINIFPTFRGGESPFFMEQFFRLIYHHFGSRTFVVRAKQMGYGEDEALFSGAFWFYYKLGFRAVNKQIRQLAEREYAKIKAKLGYRVPTSTMRKLSKTDVFFYPDSGIPDSRAKLHELSIINLGYRVTRYFGDNYEGHRQAGTADAVIRLGRILGISTRTWSEDERMSLVRFAPLLIQIPNLSRWTLAEKRLLVEIIRAKGGPGEREYVLVMNRHARLKAALEKLASRR